MASREACIIFEPTLADEAQGVTIRRSIGGERLALLDPFLLFDHVTVAPDAADVIGFPRHPHRGIETLSYVIKGFVAHKDSLGNEGEVDAGGSQWMTAGNGIFHEEMVRQADGEGEFIQLWFNLPAAKKRVPPAYIGAGAAASPVVEGDGCRVRVVCGTFNGKSGPFEGIAVQPTVLDVTLSPNAAIHVPSSKGRAAFCYVFGGVATCGDRLVPASRILVLSDGDDTMLSAGPEGSRFLFVEANRVHEPVLQYRSLVMNTVEDIRETLEMIDSGNFGKV